MDQRDREVHFLDRPSYRASRRAAQGLGDKPIKRVPNIGRLFGGLDFEVSCSGQCTSAETKCSNSHSVAGYSGSERLEALEVHSRGKLLHNARAPSESGSGLQRRQIRQTWWQVSLASSSRSPLSHHICNLRVKITEHPSISRRGRSIYTEQQKEAAATRSVGRRSPKI